MSQISTDTTVTTTPVSTAPAGNAPQQGSGQPGAGDPPSGGNEPDAGAGLLFTAGQTPPADGGGQPQGGEGGKQEAPAGAPEKYELTTKDGFAFDEATAAAVTPMFKELGLSNAQAQKLADYHMDAMQKFQAAQVEQFYQMQNAEAEAAKADPDVGGAKLAESLSLAAKAMDTYGGQEFRDALAAHGMANNVQMLKFLAKVGRELSGDRFMAGGKPQKEETAASILYPDWN
jgi:hypothetical protein